MFPFDEQARPVLVAEINKEAIEESIKSAILNFNQTYGAIRHVWVNPKDVPIELTHVDGIVLERKADASAIGSWCRERSPASA